MPFGFSLNPFKGVVKTTLRPGAEVLRTSFWQKIANTSNVFGGFGNANRPDEAKVGIFDYLTLGISFLVNVLFAWCVSNFFKSLLPKLLIVPVFLIFLPLFLARFVIVGVLTLAVSPIVGVVHLISKIFGDPLKNKLNDKQYYVTTVDIFNSKSPAGKIEFRQYIEANHVWSSAIGTYENLFLEFNKKAENDPIIGDNTSLTQKITISLDLRKKEDLEIFDAIVDLDVGNVNKALGSIIIKNSQGDSPGVTFFDEVKARRPKDPNILSLITDGFTQQ